jgi:crotonobetainyl-CoA:carnitine CoA-transferase CaiB-like acyl-CoA transferase
LEANPRLVITYVSGYGQTGVPEYISKPAWDVIGQVFGTMAALNGT